MSNQEAVGQYLSTLPGMERLTLEELGGSPGDMCLRAQAGEPVLRTYLGGETLRQEEFTLLVRRSYGGPESPRGTELSALSELAALLETRTRQGILPDLGPGKRAWSLLATQTPEAETLLEDGLLVDRMGLRLVYFSCGQA